ncbi:MAG: hypothetical protein LC800_18070 [Acidobacteria bacterium]|nr:hypothetical protein [Acidobacteriota bacterium]
MLKLYVSNPAFVSDTIFLGTVTKIEPKRVAEGFHPDNMIAVTFSIEKVWADSRTGLNTDRAVITIQTNATDGMCGIAFKEGKRYFVFAKQLRTDYCTPTNEYSGEDMANDYFKVLGEGRKPEKSGKPGDSDKKPTSAERPPRGVV